MPSTTHPLALSLTNTTPALGTGPALLACYCVVIAALAVYATHVSLSNPDQARRADAYKVLKLVWGTATGSTGILAIAWHLTGNTLL